MTVCMIIEKNVWLNGSAAHRTTFNTHQGQIFLGLPSWSSGLMVILCRLAVVPEFNLTARVHIPPKPKKRMIYVEIHFHWLPHPKGFAHLIFIIQWQFFSMYYNSFLKFETFSFHRFASSMEIVKINCRWNFLVLLYVCMYICMYAYTRDYIYNDVRPNQLHTEPWNISFALKQKVKPCLPDVTPLTV